MIQENKLEPVLRKRRITGINLSVSFNGIQGRIHMGLRDTRSNAARMIGLLSLLFTVCNLLRLHLVEIGLPSDLESCSIYSTQSC